MNKIIKGFVLDTEICDPAAVNDPERFDGYKTYDKLSDFIELTKQFYINRALRECLDICDDNQDTIIAQQIKARFKI